MELEIHYLLIGAGFFVILVILFIRAMTGAKNAVLTEEVCLDYINKLEPDFEPKESIVSNDQKSALLHSQKTGEFRLIRQHGDKLVAQTVSHVDIAHANSSANVIEFRRQDIAHPPVKLTLSSNERRDHWITLMSEAGQRKVAL